MPPIPEKPADSEPKVPESRERRGPPRPAWRYESVEREESEWREGATIAPDSSF